MLYKSILILVCLHLYLNSHGQEFNASGQVFDQNSVPVSDVSILNIRTSSGTISDSDGNFEIKVTRGDTLRFSHVQYKNIDITIRDTVGLFIELIADTTALTSIEITEKRNRDDISNVKRINAQSAEQLPSAFGDFNKVLVTMPGVSSNNELSSAYSVRGGNFDENLVYVNDIPIYRPFLSNAGRQEGLSFVNPQMVKDINFYPGGWEPKYGDKLSSSLNIEYKEPEVMEGSVTIGLLGGNAYAGGKMNNGSYLIGARHKDSRYLLNTLETDGQYFPTYTDIQSLLTFDLSRKESQFINKTKLNWLISLSRNRYLTEPTSQLTDFGTFNQNLRIETAFQGRELLNYDTYQTGLRLTHHFSDQLRMQVIGSGMSTLEREQYEVEGAYRLSDVSTRPGVEGVEESVAIRGVGSNYYYGRNSLSARIFSLENRWEYLVSPNVVVEGGAGINYQKIDDRIKEYDFTDSADYVSITSRIQNEINLQTLRYISYAQVKWFFRDTVSALVFGARANYWDFNDQLLISPRLTYHFAPKWKQPTSFNLSVGYYQQPPFYRELRDYEGQINPDVTAQRSVHFIAGINRTIDLLGRPFILTSDIYYKYLYDVIPYDVDNVRLRYFPSNDAKAYAAGVDIRLNGEFIKGTQSWFSISYLQTKEDVSGDGLGYIRRPADQRINLAIYFEDHMPIDPTLRVYLNLVFGSGYPFGPPQVPSLRNAFSGDEYYRADLGLSKQFSLRKNGFFSHLWVRAEVLNALGADNTLSYTWIEDVNGNNFAIPNSLSARFLNIKFTAEL